MEQTFESMMIEHCAPTLRGLKPANLFRYRPENRMEAYVRAAHWNRQFRPFGISVRVVKECECGAMLVYVYREAWLNRIMGQKEVRRFLEGESYQMEETVNGFLKQLAGRLRRENGFPHEIGVFLGYPLCDVIGFIENQGENYTCCGCWKSYGDPGEAQQRFTAYKRCTEFCKELFRQGYSIIQLVTAA